MTGGDRLSHRYQFVIPEEEENKATAKLLDELTEDRQLSGFITDVLASGIKEVAELKIKQLEASRNVMVARHKAELEGIDRELDVLKKFQSSAKSADQIRSLGEFNIDSLISRSDPPQTWRQVFDGYCKRVAQHPTDMPDELHVKWLKALLGRKVNAHAILLRLKDLKAKKPQQVKLPGAEGLEGSTQEGPANEA